MGKDLEKWTGVRCELEVDQQDLSADNHAGARGGTAKHAPRHTSGSFLPILFPFPPHLVVTSQLSLNPLRLEINVGKCDSHLFRIV